MRGGLAVTGLLLVGLLTSCGSSSTADADSSSVVTPSTLPGATSPGSADSSMTTGTDGEAGVTPVPVAVSQTPDTTTPDTTTPEATTPDTGDTIGGVTQFSGDAGSPFCDVVRQFDQSSPLDTAFGSSTTPESTKQNWDTVMKAFGSLRATAPDEIALDVAATTKFIDAMDRIFVENNYDMTEIAIDLEADPELVDLSGSNPELDAASERLEAYGIQVCGLAP